MTEYFNNTNLVLVNHAKNNFNLKKLNSRTSKKIKIIHQNIDSLRSKFEGLEVLLQIESPDILCVSEHHLNEAELKETHLEGYECAAYYCRNICKKGGVCFFVKNDLRINSFDSSSYCVENQIELATIILHALPINIYIIGVYRPPRANDIFFDNLTNFIIHVFNNNYNKQLIVLGDFNINMAQKGEIQNRLITVMSSFGLKQKIKSFTREVGGSKSMIDLIFTNINSQEFQSSILITALSDHHGQEILLKTTKQVNNFLYKDKKMINPKNIDRFKKLLQNEYWFSIYDKDKTMDEKYICFNNILKTHFDNAFPMKKVKLKSSCSYKIHFPTKVLEIRKKLKQLFIASKDLLPLHPLKDLYKERKRQYKQLIREEKSRFVQKQLSNSKNPSKSIWNIVNKHRNFKHNQEDIVNEFSKDQSYHTDPKILANKFNEHYINIGNNNNLKNSNVCSVKDLKSSLANSMFIQGTTELEIIKIIKTLKSSNTCGFDEISMTLLKAICFEITSPLTYLINNSIESGIFPVLLKTSTIKPIYKSGNKDEEKNYRPIAILSSISKVFEKVILDNLSSFLEQNKILPRNQFGFRKKLSTTQAMFELTHNIVSALDNNNKILALFFDLQKAFDMVPHEELLQKLELIGIRGLALNWFRSYLTERVQRVELTYSNNTTCLQKKIYSTELQIKTGVPQGSNIGPILFIIYLYDLKINSDSNVYLFADDTAITVMDKNYKNLQEKTCIDSNLLVNWFNDNGFKLNPSKTKLINFTITKTYHCKNLLEITIEQEKIVEDEIVTYLGLKIDKHLKFKQHIQYISKKLSKALFLIRRLSYFCSEEVLLQIYHSLFIAQAKYGISIWGRSSSLKSLFVLQKAAIRTIFKLKKQESCKQIFREKNILTLPCIYIFHTVNFARENPKYFTSESSPSNQHYNIRPNNLIKNLYHNKSFYENHTMFNATLLTNKLPKELQNESNLKNFKREFKKFLINKTYYSVEDYLNLP